MPWRELEQQGWIAEAVCTEIRVALSRRAPDGVRGRRAARQVPDRQREPGEGRPGRAILDRLSGRAACSSSASTSSSSRPARRASFERPAHHGQDAAEPSARSSTTGSARGELRQLVLSKVGNFAIDLPDANVLIQVSGTFGSRQEEAQRLGRILRPKADGEPAHFYTLVTRDTRELDFAHHRQLFLTEQGYSYRIEIAPGASGRSLREPA